MRGLHADRVTVVRSGRRVLDEATLAVGAGELVAVVGPNGAGKSTLLEVLAGDTTPDAGAVTLDGRPLADWDRAELARTRAVMTQQHRVGFPFPVGDVVAMGRAPWTTDAATDRRHVDDALAAADLVDLVDRSVLALSGGELARVALARTLAQDPRVLLLDEPTAALDVRHEAACLRAVRTRVEGGAAALVVLHDLSLAAAWADRVVVLAAGRVVADGAPSEVFAPELLADVYRHPIEVFPHPRTGTPLVHAAIDPATYPTDPATHPTDPAIDLAHPKGSSR